jgi:DNA-binding MarR family transcriptional regulator
VSSPGQALFGFVRHFSRRSAAPSHPADQGRLVLVTEAVHALAQRGAQTTVNAVAHEIGIDQSGASRLIRNAVGAGHLAVKASEADARQRQASVTASGRVLLERAQAWQEQVYARLTEGWSEEQHLVFQQALKDLVERSHGLDS